MSIETTPSNNASEENPSTKSGESTPTTTSETPNNNNQPSSNNSDDSYKKSMGYTAEGYILEPEQTEEEVGFGSSNGGGEGGYSDGSGGLRTVGNIITDTWEYICKLDKFGPIIINGKDNKLNLVPDKGHSNIVCELSDKTQMPIPTTLSALTAARNK